MPSPPHPAATIIDAAPPLISDDSQKLCSSWTVRVSMPNRLGVERRDRRHREGSQDQRGQRDAEHRYSHGERPAKTRNRPATRCVRFHEGLLLSVHGFRIPMNRLLRNLPM